MFTSALMILQVGGPSAGPGIFRFFSQAGPVAKVVLGLLALFSLLSWAVVIGKLVQLRRADGQSERFLEAFHRSSRFSEVNAQAGKLHASPLVGIFQAGYAEIDSQIKQRPEPRAPAARSGALPHHLPPRPRAEPDAGDHGRAPGGHPLDRPPRHHRLRDPFIGLFGTVWGIMHGLQRHRHPAARPRSSRWRPASPRR